MAGPAITTVHPSAVVSRAAELGEGVTVGPHAVVEAGAVIGRSTTIDAGAVIKGSATIGEACRLHAGVVLGDDPQDLSFPSTLATRVIVGDGTVLREHATVHRASREDGATRIGSGCLLMGSSHVAHDCTIGDQAVLCNSALVAGHVEVGDRAFISGNTVIHQFCRVGRMVMLSGASAIGRDVGPFLTVAGRSDVVGFNVVGMRRAGLSAQARSRVKEAYRRLFGASCLDEGLAAVSDVGEEHREIHTILAFYRASNRGFSRPPPGHSLAGADPAAAQDQ